MDKDLQKLIDKAMQGDVDVMVMVGKYYKNGVSTERDDTKAHEYWLMAAERGHAVAEYLIGMDYFAGFGAEQNGVLAGKYLQSAADKDFTEAQYVLGILYDGCNEDVKTYMKGNSSIFYFEKASKLGHAGAQIALGDAYTQGKGVTPNLNKAIFWYGCAYLHGEDEAERSEAARNKLNLLLRSRLINGISRTEIEKVLDEIKTKYPQYTKLNDKYKKTKRDDN